MEKKKVIVPINESKSFETDNYKDDFGVGHIDEIISYLNRAKESGANKVKFEAICGDEGESYGATLQPFFHRDETDDETNERLQREKARQEYEKNDPLFQSMRKSFERTMQSLGQKK